MEMKGGYDLKFKDGSYGVVNCNSKYDDVVLTSEELKLKIREELKKFTSVPRALLSLKEQGQMDQLHKMHAAACRRSKG